ncbi:hypothetical protein F5Y17DRAFT_36647 [Xylariaceae sp. FL0594]|nr:hypothetical protein F5Y17DRAFT_36647 [Xylariaceae sp. FL0594]
MASPAVALPNGAPAPSPSPMTQEAGLNGDASQSVNAATKRKREDTGNDGNPLNGASPDSANTSAAERPSTSSSDTDISQEGVREYYEVLASLDATLSILRRPLPEGDADAEPDAKRQKFVEGKPHPSIADKVFSGAYHKIESIITDLHSSITDALASLRFSKEEDNSTAREQSIANVLKFKKQAHDLFKRELSYPQPSSSLKALQALDPANDLLSYASGNVVLTVYGDAPRGRHLYSSLQQALDDGAEPGIGARPLKEIDLPNGVRLAKALPYGFPPPVEKEKKSKTLGELFPPPRNLPSLPPPKAPKSTTKGVQVGWHRPELTAKSKYRAGSYFSQPLATGKWLDYSNASPASPTMTKQRERALSLAGNKPSSGEVEVNELEALFRGAFSSFAPSKDDSAAVISSGLVSRTLWWQKVGQRSLDRLIAAERSDDSAEETERTSVDQQDAMQVDEKAIQQVLENWDDSLVDPSLEEACCPRKADEDKDVDDILQDVSDMIQTLISYQKNRNLALPTASSQGRYATDPAHSDMLTNGTHVQPGEEEMATYETLKAQLVMVIQMLPPYAVARLNSDKLNELNISTKLEIRTDEYQGVMEEDETAARARATQTAAARPATARQSSVSNNVQYGQQYHQNSPRSNVPAPQFHPIQTPVRPPQHAVQRAPQTRPAAYPPRAPSTAGYRPPGAYQSPAYPQQYNKAGPGYSQSSFTSTPSQNRAVYSTPNSKYVPGYNNLGHLGTAAPQTRFQQYNPMPNNQPHFTHQPYQPQQPHPGPQQPPPPAQPHAPYGHYPNGGSPMPARTTTAASPHMHHQQPHSPHVPQAYAMGTPSRQPSYSNQPHMANNPPRPYYPPSGGTHVPPPMPNHQMPNQQHGPGHPLPGTSSFQTSLNPHQVQQASM